MRPMRRQDRAVTAPEKVRAVIDACEVCRLGLQDGRGVYVVPVNFGHTVEGGRHVFYFHGAAEGRKVDLVRRNGWAGFELDTGYRLQGAEAACGYTAAFQSVIGEGPIRVVETAEERRRGLAAIMRQATCCGDWSGRRCAPPRPGRSCWAGASTATPPAVCWPSCPICWSGSTRTRSS